jgi:cytochrome c553
MTRLTLLAALLLAVFAVPARAQDAAPDVSGKVALCAACHGAAGVPVMPNAPVLWGQNEGYIYLQLKDLKNNVRVSPMMNGVAAAMSREEMFAYAKYFAEKTWPNLAQPSASADIARKALTVDSSIGCTGCHNADFRGNSAIPRLAGLGRQPGSMCAAGSSFHCLSLRKARG